MNYVKIIRVKSGSVWLMNANENGIFPEQFSSKFEYQKIVSDLIVKDVIGNFPISHQESGAPILEGKSGSHLSISHSHELFSIYYSELKPVGVDVEIIKRNLHEGRHYFLNEEELPREWTNIELHIIWSVKEAMFKLKQGNIKELISSVTVKRINEDSVLLEFQEKSWEFGLWSFEDAVLIYT